MGCSGFWPGYRATQANSSREAGKANDLVSDFDRGHEEIKFSQSRERGPSHLGTQRDGIALFAGLFWNPLLRGGAEAVIVEF